MKYKTYLTPASFIFLGVVFLCGACCQKVVKFDDVRIPPSSSHQATEKHIELMELPFLVDIPEKSYFTFDEVMTYYNNNYSVNDVTQFVILKTKMIQSIQQIIDGNNMIRSFDSHYKPESINDYPLYYYNKGYCETGRDLIGSVGCIETLKSKILREITNLRN